MNITEATKVLTDFYHFANTEMFHIESDAPQITIQTRGKHNAYGWITTKKVWAESDKTYYEINICAEYLSRPIEEVTATLLHEMVHLLNVNNQIQDVSRGGAYHNKEFKKTAEAHGLHIEQAPKIGWSVTTLDEKGKALVQKAIKKGLLPTEKIDLFRLQEMPHMKTKKKSHIRKYVCPCCGAIVRASKAVRVSCDDCEERMIEEE